MTDHYDVFLSYSQGDQEAATNLRGQLRGLSVFFDKTSIREGISGSTAWRQDPPTLVAEPVEPLTEQHRTFERYRQGQLSDQAADHAIMTMFREGVINVQRIADVEREWQEPSFSYEAYVRRSAWQLFNAATFALKGRVTDYDTPKLHQVIDGVCEVVH